MACVDVFTSLRHDKRWYTTSEQAVFHFRKYFSKNICLYETSGLIFAAAKHKTTVLNSKHNLRK